MGRTKGKGEIGGREKDQEGERSEKQIFVKCPQFARILHIYFNLALRQYSEMDINCPDFTDKTISNPEK